MRPSVRSERSGSEMEDLCGERPWTLLLTWRRSGQTEELLTVIDSNGSSISLLIAKEGYNAQPHAHGK